MARVLFALTVASAALALHGCATCGRCAYSLQLDVILATPDVELAVDDSAVSCRRVDGRLFQCTADYEPGDYQIVLSAVGHEDRVVPFTVGPYSGGSLGCSACPGGYYERVELIATDAAPLPDGGVGDGG